ncbi:MAG: hypothetical protein DRJ42_22870 [Deltaproteobacteria bacterium]|nr:MAG: hypothetical protein DRJ42_22870 [Deltaproteobacteria bacterium]
MFVLLSMSRAVAAQEANVDGQTEAAATADAEADARTEEARALFEEGLGLAAEERFEEAAERFRRAYQLRPASPIAFNLGNALVEGGHLVEGTEMLRQVARDPNGSSDLRERAQWIIDNAESRIGSIVVQVTGHLDDVVVDVAGASLAPASYGVPISADPGPTEVNARRGAETVASATADVPEGGQVEVSLDVPAPLDDVALLPIEAPADEGASADGGVLGKWWFWTAVGAVVVGVVIAALVVSTSSSNTEGSLGSGMLQ